VKRIAIAGGIGAGKTVVSHYLSSRGWPVVDADVVARQISEPGQPAWRALRDAFGDAVLGPDGSLDRQFLADIVFYDQSALRRLNHITHGHIGAEIVRQLDTATGPAAFVALPLFVPEHRAIFSLDAAWAVQVEPDTAVARLCGQRGFSQEDARARLASQISNDERAAIVDRVLWNEGSIDDLYAQLDTLMEETGLGRE
jgi:dephospho-CoA kinase